MSSTLAGLALPLLALFVASPLVGQEVTDEQVAAGAALYGGDGGCSICHGPDAKGVPGMTKDLTNGEWTAAEGGTLEALAGVIKDGLSAAETGGMPMPAATLDAAQIKAMAAYVRSLSGSQESPTDRSPTNQRLH